jgi:hypothetical protein
MRVPGIGVTLALALVGVAAGYGSGVLLRTEPVTFASPAPVAAADPSWPAEPVPVLPDPDLPALATGLRTHRETVGTPPFALRLPIPDGWVRTDPAAGEWRWHPPARFLPNTYFLRVRLVGNLYQSIGSALDHRLDALRDAADVAGLDVESMTSQGYTATYVAGDHLRVSMERFIGAGSGATAYASIALVGREADRPGMDELFPRIVRGATP